MKRDHIYAFFVMALLVLNASCKKDHDDAGSNNNPQPTVLTATGDINARLNEFRNILGSQLNNTPGQTTGRREINWDGVPAQFTQQSIPKDFFNLTSAGAAPSQQRGFAYDTDGDFRVSTNGFGNIEPTLSAQLVAFSGDKLFANTTSFAWDTQFRVAGTTQPAAIKGFGAVFIDVDLAQQSSLEFFNGDKSLGKFFAPVHDASSAFSFLGVYFPEGTVTKVRITHGNSVISQGDKDITSGGTKDVVALDDFLYDEPKAQ